MYTLSRPIKIFCHVLLAWLATSAVPVLAGEDYLNAPDRIEWTGGALYDGVFSDGTRFQMELGYPFPPDRGGAAGTWFHPSYWYPKYYQGIPIPLGGSHDLHYPVRLVRSVPAKWDLWRDEEFFNVDLAPDKTTGHGHWQSVSMDKELDFTLQRAIAYKSVLVRRPYRNRVTGQAMAGPLFEYSALFPVVGHAEADAWIREQARSCEADQQCLNRVRVTWKSDHLLSIHAVVGTYNNGAAHSESYERTRHYQVSDGQLTPLDFASFIKPGGACRARISKGIVASLRAQKAPWATKAALQGEREPAFTATPSGIAFHFESSQVKGQAEGNSTAFVALKPNDPCVRFLPAYDQH